MGIFYLYLLNNSLCPPVHALNSLVKFSNYADGSVYQGQDQLEVKLSINFGNKLCHISTHSLDLFKRLGQNQFSCIADTFKCSGKVCT